ncbi:MAG: carbohydrate porin [Oscillatoriophycideae cyanobacterium NC_groundwater_1537_Pr4_S-0.65um_50_18]|nr:carbohydrate porin [Oscillatoriophycideae cyanobacterium NC_groundwater_1537_Pr4_S-0.65um_50_18]
MSSKFLWKSFLTAPALLGAALIVASSAVASEIQPKSDALPLTSIESSGQQQAPVQAAQTVTEQASPISTSDVAPLTQVAQYSGEGVGSQDQVTSISQLSDVQPTDWAFQALQSLVERYGCIAGYPDGTYKGSRAMTRYEFAAGMNACLDRISELIASSTADLATQEDLATLQRLQEEFAAELATLRGRVDSLEARTAELEANQFSTTTKLRGETIFQVGIPIENGVANAQDDQVNFGYRVRLNLDTSFTGEDLLRARLQALDFNNHSAFGSSTRSTQWFLSSASPTATGNNNVSLDDLYYRFPIGPARISIWANSLETNDLVSTEVSPLANNGAGSLLRFGRPAQYDFFNGNAGATVFFKFNDNLGLDLAYSGGGSGTSAASSELKNGLFDGNYSAVAQLNFLSSVVDASLTYGNTYRRNGFFGFRDSLDSTDLGNPEVANVYAGQFNFKFGSVEIGGGGAYIPIRRIGDGDYNVWSFQGTLAFKDLGGEGNMLGILAGIAPYAAGVPTDSVVNSRFNQRNNFVAEVFYRYNVNDNIAITPSLIYLDSPGNNSNNDSSFVGAVRTTFRF